MTGQLRYHFSGQRAEMEARYKVLEAAFEDDGWPLAIVEIDEAEQIYEVSLYADDDVPAVTARISDLLELADPSEVGVEELPDIDWVTHTLQGLTPVRAGRFLIHGSHDRDRVRPGDISIEIDAGLAFGTGHHGTTAGCLEMISRVVASEHPRNALDLGTGSAVLAIALAHLAHIPVLATDIDPVATKVAATNVRINQAASLVDCVTATGFRHTEIARRGPFDLIVANVLARPLMQLAPDMAHHISPGGSLILSGILAYQRRAVLAAYNGQGFRHVRTFWRGDWVTIHLKR